MNVNTVGTPITTIYERAMNHCTAGQILLKQSQEYLDFAQTPILNPQVREEAVEMARMLQNETNKFFQEAKKLWPKAVDVFMQNR